MELRKRAASMVVFTLLLTIALASLARCVALVFNGQAFEPAHVVPSVDQYFPDALAPPTEWNKTYGGSGWDVANSVLQTSDGGYLLAGYTESYGAGKGDFWLVKTNSAGRMLWNRTFGGSEYDEAESLVQVADGGYVLAGVTRSYGAGVTDFWLVKTDSDGNREWNRTYGGVGLEYLYSAIRTTDNGFALAGYTQSYGAGGSDFWLVRTDSSGNALWNRTYGGVNQDEAHAVVQTGDGGYAIVGETDSAGAGGTDMWWVKTAPDGAKQRDQTYGGVNDDGAYSLLQTSDGGYVIAGYTESYGYGIPGYPDFWLVKIDSSGKARPVWDQTFGGSGADSAESVIGVESGGFAVAGATQLYGNASDRDFWLITTDTAGNMNWNQTFGGYGDDYAHSVIETSDRSYALAGDTFSYGVGSADMWLVKVEGSIPVHDVAVIGVSSAKTVVGQGYSLLINVTVENHGNRVEAVNVTAYANSVVVGTLHAFETLSTGAVRVFSLTWNVTKGEFPKGNYTLSADVAIAPPITDSDPTDNSYSDGSVSVSFAGDVNADGKVDAFDVYELGKAYASRYGGLSWNANCDIDNNGIVNAEDLSVVNENYGSAGG